MEYGISRSASPPDGSSRGLAPNVERSVAVRNIIGTVGNSRRPSCEDEPCCGNDVTDTYHRAPPNTEQHQHHRGDVCALSRDTVLTQTEQLLMSRPSGSQPNAGSHQVGLASRLDGFASRAQPYPVRRHNHVNSRCQHGSIARASATAKPPLYQCLLGLLLTPSGHCQ
jgi:hypothetical protein